jgi:uncharacterized RDD family membrane protein YckC
MLEQNDENKSVIEGSDDIDNKVKNEELIGVGVNNQNSSEYTKKPTLMDTFKASIIDLVIIGGISTIGVYVADAVLRMAGYAITQKFQMTFIIFMVVMVLYMSIMECGKKSATIGKKISGLTITKG